jgi:glycosyltransferase involved in cell wall biosynthesis
MTFPADKRVGFLTYDLQPFTEDCLHRVACAIAPSQLKAYPVIHHEHETKARLPYLASNQKGRYRAVNQPGSTPEGFASNLNWQAAWYCASESDVVVLFGLQGVTALLTALLATLMRRPIVSVNQTLPVQAERRRRWWVRLLKKWLLRRCHVHVFQTPAAQEVLTQVYGIDPTAMVSAPFEAGASYFRPLLAAAVSRRDELRSRYGATSGTLFLYVGNLHLFKGVADLIQALAKLPKEKPFCCLFAGLEEPNCKEGGTIAYYTQLAQRLEIADRVRFLGSLPHAELAGVYWAADAVILPTHKDCFPKVLVEGALAHKPLVTTYSCGAVGALVIDGENGFVHAAGNVPGLADILMRLLDPGLRTRMGERSAVVVERFCDAAAETAGFARAIACVLNVNCKEAYP